MGLISGLLTKANPYMLYIKLGLVAAAAVSVLCAYLWIHHAFTERAELRVKVVELNTKIKDQNAAIDKWKQEADRATEKAEAAQAQAAKVQVVYRTKVETIMGATVSKNCDEAVKWGVKEGRTAGTEWERIPK
jgi:hypothetical protein